MRYVTTLHTPTWESTAVILLGGLRSCVLVRLLTKVDCHRITQSVLGISHVADAILRNDGVYIAGIKNNTRAMVECSAGSEFITKLYVVAILKLLAVWESGVY